MRLAESSTNKITPARKPVMLNGYLPENANRAFEICWTIRWAESSTNENNTGEKTGDVERSPGLALLLDTEFVTQILILVSRIVSR